MKKLFFVCFVFFCAFSSMSPENKATGDDRKPSSLIPSIENEVPLVGRWIDSVYNIMNLDSFGLTKTVFYYAFKGYQYLLSKNQLSKPSLLTICDYSQSSTQKRLYIIDIDKGELLYNTYVSHGKNSGEEFATSFSNRTESHKSSLGFMITGSTYKGKAGYSMRLDGVESGINDKVRARDIVMHGSTYVNAKRVSECGSMGRSFGCPAVSYEEHKKIINLIKEGSCFFVYGEDKFYATSSRILGSHFDWPLFTNSSSRIVNISALEKPALAGIDDGL